MGKKNQEKHAVRRKHKVTEVSPNIAAIMANLHQGQPKDWKTDSQINKNNRK